MHVNSASVEAAEKQNKTTTKNNLLREGHTPPSLFTWFRSLAASLPIFHQIFPIFKGLEELPQSEKLKIDRAQRAHVCGWWSNMKHPYGLAKKIAHKYNSHLPL